MAADGNVLLSGQLFLVNSLSVFDSWRWWSFLHSSTHKVHHIIPVSPLVHVWSTSKTFMLLLLSQSGHVYSNT